MDDAYIIALISPIHQRSMIRENLLPFSASPSHLQQQYSSEHHKRPFSTSQASRSHQNASKKERIAPREASNANVNANQRLQSLAPMSFSLSSRTYSILVLSSRAYAIPYVQTQLQRLAHARYTRMMLYS
ncbi:hypothetical protein AMTR_s00036p00048090 [Amborella trichopoda]|uniref:Uncharacterized protein n=1 Tax=Amborella trichopoda TaxID=13333 RepID=U5CQ38_AMBTC|nr:hypothetical protein AMTR_s00036p00048090 [Amborella trichopoda]